MENMIIKRTLFLIVFIISIHLHSQDTRIWSTYFGGPGNDDGNVCLARDVYGNVYFSGQTASTSGIASGGFQNSYGGGQYDAYLAKYSSTGALLWATYYGGSGTDQAASVITDKLGNVYLAGFTTSTAGISSSGFQNTFGGGQYDAFIVKFNSSGSRQWATYYGGAGSDYGNSIAIDTSGNIYLAGSTMSSASISATGHQNSFSGGSIWGDAFLVKLNSSGVRQWATYYGGTNDEQGNCVTVDFFGNIYLVGNTASSTNIFSSGFQSTLGGGDDCFLAKFNSTGTLIWGTYYGGPATDWASCVSADNLGNVYISGMTVSVSGISSNGFQNTIGGSFDSFLIKFNSSGNRKWGTYYGGSSSESASRVATDNLGSVYLASLTYSTSNIASTGFQNTNGGLIDAYLVKFDSVGTRNCATYFGGVGEEYCHGLVTDTSGNIYIAGRTQSTTAIASGGFQNAFGGGTWDGYVAKFSSCPPLPSSINNELNSTNVEVYPNPSKGIFNLNITNTYLINKIVIYNIIGEKIKECEWNKSETTIDISGCMEGVYFIRIDTEKKSEVKKIILQK